MKIVGLILILLLQTFLPRGAYGNSTFVATQLLMNSARVDEESEIDGNDDSVKIIYGNATETETVYRKSFPKEKWRRQGEQYLYCPGEYRIYAGLSRCRIPGTGLNGVMGGMEDAATSPLFNHLAEDYNLPGIKIISVEQTPNTLTVEFVAAENGKGIQESVYTVVSRITPKQWVKRDQRYFFCPGEYRTYFGEKRCRSKAHGLNGAMGGMVDELETPLEAFLAKEQGWASVDLVDTEEIGGSLQAVYSRSEQEANYAGSQPNKSVPDDQKVENIETAGSPTAAIPDEFVLEADSEQYPKEIALILDVLDSGFFKFMAFPLIFLGIVNGIGRQSIVQFAVGFGGGIGMLNAAEIFRNTFAAPPVSPGSGNDLFGTGILIVLVIGIGIFVGYNLVKPYLWRRRLNHLNAVLASIDDFERRQQSPAREELTREAADDGLPPISNSRAEELEIDKRRRKILLD
jgi:hypothetical protein